MSEGERGIFDKEENLIPDNLKYVCYLLIILLVSLSKQIKSLIVEMKSSFY